MKAIQAKKHREFLHLQGTTLLDYIELSNSTIEDILPIPVRIISRFSNNLLGKLISVDFASFGISTEISPDSFESIELQLLSTQEPSKRSITLILLSDLDLLQDSDVNQDSVRMRIDQIYSIVENDISHHYLISPIIQLGELFSQDFWNEINQYLALNSESRKNITFLNGLDSKFSTECPIVESDSPLKDSQPLTFKAMQIISLYVCREACKRITPGAKMILLDADNTLWKGVLGESSESYVLDQFEDEQNIYFKFQVKIKELKENGTLISLVTKNNPEDVIDLFKRDSRMPLKLADFVEVRAGWGDKWESARSIAEVVSLGLDSFVFFDDNPVEREGMRRNLPEIFVPEPDSTGNFFDYFDLIIPLSSRGVSKEDKRRSQYYEKSKLAAEAAKGFSDRSTFLKSLDMRASVTTNSTLDSARALQLIQKTNQFNMTGLRLNLLELQELLNNPKYFFFQVALEDKFGDHGNVLLMATEQVDWDLAEIRIYNMSCRAIGRNLEFEFLEWALLRIYAINGISQFNVVVCPSQKNSAFLGFFRSAGFSQVSENTYRIDLKAGSLSEVASVISIEEH